MSDTHVNVFIKDVEDAHQAALEAVDRLKVAADALVAKLKTDEPVVAQKLEVAAQDAAKTADKVVDKAAGENPKK